MKIDSLFTRSIFVITLLMSGYVNAQPKDESKPTATQTNSADLIEFRLAQDKAAEGFSEQKRANEASLFVSNQVELSSIDLSEVTLSQDASSKPIILLKFNSAGAEKFKKLTTSHINQTLAMMSEGKLLSAFQIMEKIDTDRLIIALKDAEQTKALVLKLQAQLKTQGKAQSK